MLETRPSSWSAFKNWKYIRIPDRSVYSWTCFASLEGFLRRSFVEVYEEFGRLLAQWDDKLEPFGGDPNRRSWETFRPLRLSREEDWSDWLAFIIESSRTGYFPRLLFAPRTDDIQGCVKASYVVREDIQEPYRADLIVRWENCSYSHIEVKTGDMKLAKTFGTSKALQEKYRTSNWSNFILLLPNQLEEWERTRSEENLANNNASVQSISWADVAVALRKSLVFSTEDLAFNAWCYAFLGSVGQKLLGIPRFSQRPPSSLIPLISSIRLGIEILKEGIRNETSRKNKE